MTRDRGQKTGAEWDTVINILIVAVVGYVILGYLGISLWDVALVGGGLVVLVLGLLLARGMYLIGSGSDAEYQARSKAAECSLMGGGFALLDGLRTADLPIVNTLESLIGRETPDRMVKCTDCRTAFFDDSGGADGCPNCGSHNIEVRG